MDDSEALERVAKMRAQKEAERTQRQSDKKEFMRPQKTLDFMLRESRARMNFMKDNQNVMTIPGSVEWHSVKRVASFHSSFDRWLKLYNEAETYLQAAFQNGDEALIEEYRAKANGYLKECVFNSYKVGFYYNQFLVGAERMAGKDG